MTNEPEPNTRAGEAFDPPCTDCGDTGVTFQTERACTCDAATRPLPQPSELVEAKTFTHEELARIYRRAQLTAEEKLCREQANSEGLKRRTKVLEAQIAKLQADGDKLAGALKRSRTGWANVLELGLLPVTHEDTALDLGMEATQALTEWKDRA